MVSARSSLKRPARRRVSTRNTELAALKEIGSALSSAWDLATMLQAISRTTARVMRMDSCSIYLLDPAHKTLILKASTGLAAASVDLARLALGEGITGYAAETGKPVAVRNAANDARFKFLPETQEQDFKSLLAVPLLARGDVIGAMNVQTRIYHHYTRPEIELLGLIGDLAAGALERAALHDKLQRQLQELATLAQVSQTVTAPLYLGEMLSVVAEMAAQIMRARATALFLFDDEQKELTLRASYGLSQAHLHNLPLHVESSLTGQVIMLGAPVMVRDVRDDPLYQNRDLARQEGLLSFLAVPLKVRDKIIGAFNCYLGEVHEFTAPEIELFSTLANQMALAIENANLAMNALLVREMHHRVKNNLQMVAMLLRLQIREEEQNPNAALGSRTQALQETIHRILGIAAVHEALSQEGSREIGVKALLQQAASVARQTMSRPGQELRVLVEGQDVKLSSQPATSLAMAVNELIQNALEHGFPEQGGTVHVRLERGSESLQLAVSDDGIGLAPGAAARSSLGLQIVQALVTEDLNGTFRLEGNSNGRGTTATIVIPMTAIPG